jgi:hypothetical protein
LQAKFCTWALLVSAIVLSDRILFCQTAEQETPSGEAKKAAAFLGPAVGSIAKPSSGESKATGIPDLPQKQLAPAVISIADYFPLYPKDFQVFADKSKYILDSTTYTLHGHTALLSNIYIYGVLSSGQYLSFDSAGTLRQHGIKMQALKGWVDAIFDHPMVWGTASMQMPITFKDSAHFSIEGHSGTVELTLEYLGIDETSAIHTVGGNLRRCVVIHETDRIAIPSLGVDEPVTKIIYLAKRIREVALNNPSDSPLMTQSRVGDRLLGPTLALSGGARDAVAESNTMPTGQRIPAGSSRLVTMTFRNRGLLPWHPDDGFRLGAVGDSDPFVSANRIYLAPGTTVLPGETYTFPVILTAPTTGSLVTDWRMVQDGVVWFGETLTKRITISDTVYPNLSFSAWDFAPMAPAQMRPGEPFALGTLVDNNGGATAKQFWLETWGSRTGGLMLDLMLLDSDRVGPLLPGEALPYIKTKPLYSVPDGLYTVVFVADRPNQVGELYETDNRAVVGSKRLLVLRPPTNADLAVQAFTFGPNPVRKGQRLTLGGQVRNVGTQDSGPFWIEFWGAYDRVNPQLDFYLCDSIEVSNLAPGAAINLSAYSRTLYNTCPTGIFMAGVFVDRLDQVNELDETNNYSFIDNIRLNLTSPAANEDDGARTAGPDLVVVNADSSPSAPTQAIPGSIIQLSARVENRGTVAGGPFWLEFWGSKLGGLSLDEFLADSERVPGIPAGGAVDLNLTRSLYSIPDGPYAITVVADRLNEVGDSNRTNNRRAVAAKRLLTVRPPSNANVRVEGLLLPNPISTGEPFKIKGVVRNVGTQPSGPFWIEFWASPDQSDLTLRYPLCDSILVPNLAPDQYDDLSSHTHLRSLYPNLPTSPTLVAIICFADRNDLVNETNEADNYLILRGYRILQPNLKLEGFSFGPNPVHLGEALQIKGTVQNLGPGNAGPFWVEFWAALNPAHPTPDIQICNSIYVPGLVPHATADLSTPPLFLRTNLPTGPCSIICHVDRANVVIESNEADNSIVLPGYQILP